MSLMVADSVGLGVGDAVLLLDRVGVPVGLALDVAVALVVDVGVGDGVAVGVSEGNTGHQLFIGTYQSTTLMKSQ